MTQNPIHAVKITIYNKNTPKIQKYVPRIQQFRKSKHSKTFKFLFCYISNFHNSYFVYFVYFIYVVYFIYFVFIYIFVYIYIYTYTCMSLYTCRTQRAQNPQTPMTGATVLAPLGAFGSAAPCLQGRERAGSSPEFMQVSYNARNTFQEPRPLCRPSQKLHPLTALAAQISLFEGF